MSQAAIHFLAHHRLELLGVYPDLKALIMEHLPLPGTPTRDELRGVWPSVA